jgi:hypothetical protein
MPCFGGSVPSMPHEPRHISFLGREGRFKHYGIGTHAPEPRRALVEAVAARVPAGEVGFTIAHDARSAGLGLVYWWANENELHRAAYVSPLDSPGELEALVDAGLACVWEFEIIDFERRAWLHDVLVNDDLEGYLERALEPVAV